MKKFNSLSLILLRSSIYNSIPDDEPVSRQKFALFRIFSYTGAAVCIAVATKMFITINQVGFFPILIIFLGIIMQINFFLAGSCVPLKKAYTIMLIAAVALLHIVSYSCGGIRTAGSMYFGVILLYAYMLLGKRGGKIFTFIVVAHIIYLYFISTYTNWTSFDLFKGRIDLINQDFLINAILAFLLIAVQGNYLQSGKNELIQRLEKQKLMLEEKNKTLEKNNSLLNIYTSSLEKTNKELRKFASVASHDLKAPLRAIGSLADFIEDEEKGKLNDKSRNYLEVLKKRVNRMDSLINALLEYSKAGEKSDMVLNIDLEKLITKAALKHISGSHINIQITGKFPMLKINEIDAAKVFNALIANAIFFNDKEAIEIEINCTSRTDDFFITVKDNGPGIANAFHEKIFVIFQTLNPRDEVETMGVGLPIARKIVEGWNGTITLESSVGKGSSFIFTIPKSLEVFNISKASVKKNSNFEINLSPFKL